MTKSYKNWLPNQIECKIETTDAAIKGQTAASSYKPALLENGVNIQVPPFVESGDSDYSRYKINRIH